MKGYPWRLPQKNDQIRMNEATAKEIIARLRLYSKIASGLLDGCLLLLLFFSSATFFLGSFPIQFEFVTIRKVMEVQRSEMDNCIRRNAMAEHEQMPTNNVCLMFTVICKCIVVLGGRLHRYVLTIRSKMDV